MTDIRKLNKAKRKQASKHLKEDSKRYSSNFVIVAGNDFSNTTLMKAFRNDRFLVQFHKTPFENVECRLSILRTAVDAKGEWVDKITWDEIQEIKEGVGFGDSQAIEIYPKDDDVINVANIRHIWVLKEPLDITLRG